MTEPEPADAPEPTESAERHASWLELFFDLVAVAGIGALAHLLAEDSSNGGIAPAHGIHSSGSGSLIEDNLTTGNTGNGIKSDGGPGADTIIRNTATANTAGNYLPATGTQFAPLQVPNTANSPFANF